MQKDDDGFKMPAPVKRKAPSSSESGITSPIAKRTRISEEGASDESTSSHGPSRGRGRGRGARGRGRGRLGLGYSSKATTTKEEPKEAGPSLPTESKPKSQDDFRAMLLGKK